MMEIVEFGTALLNTLDLDPVYVMLHYSGIDLSQKKRFCVAYWCYYSAGVAARLSEYEGPQFWKECLRVFPIAPRGTERRHFRGFEAANALEDLKRKYLRAEDFVDCLSAIPEFLSVSETSQTHSQFGPWIAFKIADMLERCLEVAVDFRNCELFLYRDPQRGAELAALRYGLKNASAAIQYLERHFGKRLAPPKGDRNVNIQEIETILCKWKSHINGHYSVGKDSREVLHSLRALPTQTGSRFAAVLEEKCRVCLAPTLI